MRLAILLVGLLLASWPGESRARPLLASAMADAGLTRIFVDALVAELRTRMPDVELDLSLDGRRGGETELLDMLKAGDHDLHVGTIHGAVYYPELDATLVPYLFPDFAAVERFLAGPVGRRMGEALERRGKAVLVGTYDLGPRWTTANRPIATADDLATIKIRMPEVPLWIRIWGAMGAAVTPIAAPEVPQALRDGAVDAQENVLSNIVGRGIVVAQRYLIATGHQHGFASVLASRAYWQKLSPERRGRLQAAIVAAGATATRMAAAENARLLERLETAGMVRMDPSPTFRQKALPIVEKAALESLAPGVYEAALAAIEGRR
ncbi:hypothetical protein STAQ_04400 [Allostella sp. ATCC 35155]|nr:hypothetical protein STAQ_04400 [Stella sp. ATCC 35155]